MADAIKLDTELNINLRKLDRDIAQISKRINRAGTFQINDKASAPLGRITGNVKDFDSSLNAATQRVVAFGAAAAVFNVLQNAFSSLVKSVINVEDSLAKINVNLGQSREQIAGFADEIFKAAGATGKTFEEAAKGAEELARQGLGAEETITRLNDALILSRLAGIDTTAAVESLTAAVNSFSSEAVTTTDILNKFVAVDTRFAVSTRDLQEAISRVGTTAGEAGVSLDELNGIVTAVQQSTARGGAVIGNAFKTIFTRLARPETLTQLEELGVAVKDLQGNTLPAIQILKNFAAVQDTLSDAQKQSVKESVAGVFQINILNAALNDLSKNYGVAERAQRASSEATDEAIRKNEELNKTLKSQINEAGQLITQFFSKLGEAGASTPLSEFIGTFNQVLSSLTGANAEGIGKDIGDGLIKGIANVLSGPGLIIALGAIFKAITLVTAAIKGDLKGLLDITGQSERRLAVEKQIAVVMASATNEEKENLALATSLVEKKNQLLLIEKRINAERALNGQGNLIGALAGSKFGRKTTGGISNFADPLGDAISREKKAGVNPKDIYVGQDSRLISPQNPMGLLVANKRDEPMGGAQGVNRAISEGKNPKTYKGSKGEIPNFALFNRTKDASLGDQFGIRLSPNEIDKVNSLIIDYGSALLQNNKVLQQSIKNDIEKLNLDKDSLRIVKASLRQEESDSKEITKTNKQIESLKKKQIRAGSKGYSSPIGPNLPVLPTAIIRGGSNKATATQIAATQQQSGGRSSIALTGNTIRNQQVEFARSTLERESLQGVIQDTFRRAASGIIPTDREIRRIRGIASRQVLSEPEFQGFTKGEIVGGSAPKPIIDLYKERLRTQLQNFDQNVENAREVAARGLRGERLSRASNVLGRVGLRGSTDIKKLAKAGINTKDIDIQNLLEGRRQQRAGRASSIGLGASFLAPLLSGFIPQGKGGTFAGQAGGAAAGALNFGATGATIGSFFGPLGTAVGAGVGAIGGGLVGAFGKLNKSAEELTEEFSQINDKEQARIQAINQYIQVQEQLNEAIKSGASSDTIGRFRERRESILGGVNTGTRKSLESFGFDIEELSKFSDKQGGQFTKIQRDQVAAIKLLKELGSGGANAVGLRDIGGIGSLLDRVLSGRQTTFGRVDLAGIQVGLPDQSKIRDLSSSIAPAIQSNPKFADLLRSSRESLIRAGSYTAPNEKDLSNINKVIDELRSSSKEFADVAPVTARSFLLIRDSLVDASLATDKLNLSTKKQAEEDDKLVKTRLNLARLRFGNRLQEPSEGLRGFTSLRGSAQTKATGQDAFIGALTDLKSLGLIGENNKISESLGFSIEKTKELNDLLEKASDRANAIISKKNLETQIKDFTKSTGTSLDEAIQRGGSNGIIAQLLKQKLSVQTEESKKILPSDGVTTYAGGNRQIPRGASRPGDMETFYRGFEQENKKLFENVRGGYGVDTKPSQNKEEFGIFVKAIAQGLAEIVKNNQATPINRDGLIKIEGMEELQAAIEKSQTKVTVDITNNGKLIATVEETAREVEGLKISVAQQGGKPLPPKTGPKYNPVTNTLSQ